MFFFETMSEEELSVGERKRGREDSEEDNVGGGGISRGGGQIYTGQ
mgnify:CR=1 FL=1